ncbi:MAG: DNA repair protein RecN [Ruminococcaceae bacterium]|nr:DNA repair protein RecN [Oscillospiraceae bacterium]
MLSELYIENIAVIEKSNISFSKGLNVLTGETGAGKSIVIDSIGAVLGFRTSRELVRTGADKAVVSALFTNIGKRAEKALENIGVSYDSELLIQREITLSGKNNCRINGSVATVSMLRDLGRHLINIHGQHESYELMSPDLHIRYIDTLGAHKDLLERYKEAFEHLRSIESQLKKRRNDEQERERRIDILRFQIDELSSSDISVGEYDSLMSERTTLMNLEKIRDGISKALYKLGSDSADFASAITLADEASSDLSTAARYNQSAESLSERLSDLTYELRDIYAECEDIISELDADPQRLDYVENRIDLLNNLFKKYGSSEEELIEYMENAEKELEALLNYEEHFEKLSAEYNVALDNAKALAKELSEKRKTVSDKFCKAVSEEMSFLDMPKATLAVEITPCELYDNGAETIEFLVSTNVGEPPKPVAKIASGGELSRMMLAIKTVLSKADPTDTLIFDEVDSGVSGSAAERIGIKLKEASKDSQVLCVTHLPQIAAQADNHYKITKRSDSSRTFTSVDILDEQGRIEELARIMGGVDVSDTARDYAKDLLKKFR